mmetsp:Transcript_14385/g.48756  ORF Transcript_14385/g.48756 Transcript_14385/m.48756 type:complete len:349 (-) Transcript_14385:994-2040(-)
MRVRPKVRGVPGRRNAARGVRTPRSGARSQPCGRRALRAQACALAGTAWPHVRQLVQKAPRALRLARPQPRRCGLAGGSSPGRTRPPRCLSSPSRASRTGNWSPSVAATAASARRTTCSLRSWTSTTLRPARLRSRRRCRPLAPSPRAMRVQRSSPTSWQSWRRWRCSWWSPARRHLRCVTGPRPQVPARRRLPAHPGRSSRHTGLRHNPRRGTARRRHRRQALSSGRTRAPRPRLRKPGPREARRARPPPAPAEGTLPGALVRTPRPATMGHHPQGQGRPNSRRHGAAQVTRRRSLRHRASRHRTPAPGGGTGRQPAAATRCATSSAAHRQRRWPRPRSTGSLSASR